MKIGLISNTLSQRNKRGLPNCYKALAVDRNCRHAALAGIAGLPAVLADFARNEVAAIAINGGDGSGAAVMTELRRVAAFEAVPKLAVLPGGMTNMTAADVGMRGSLAKALERFLALATRAGSPRIAERSALRLEIGDGGAPLYGMFFGAAAIYRAIETCRRLMHPMKLESEVAAGATLAFLLARRILLGGDGDAVFRGDPMEITCDGKAVDQGEQLLALVTTLERLVLASRPFWGQGGGALHFTRIAFPPARLARALYPVLYGGPERRLPSADYISCNVDRVAFRMACAFTLDGELFQAPAEGPVTLSDGGPFQFLQ